MANLTETAQFDTVTQLETTDVVVGGPGGKSNQQAQQLTNRTAWLKNHVDNLESGASQAATDAGTVNALVVTFNPAFTALSSGFPLRVKVAVTNTGATTLKVDALPAKTIKKYGSIDLEAGDLVAGDMVSLIYDGVNFQLQSQPHRVYGRKNYIINGNFDIWQRGTTSTSITGYGCADRWFTSYAGSTFIASQQQFTVGQTLVPNEPENYLRIIVSSVAGTNNYVNLQQRIENVRSLAGKTATLSFWAKADANKNILFELKQSFGTGGSATNPLAPVQCALTTVWQKFTITLAIPSIAGKTVGISSHVQLIWWLDAGSGLNTLGQQNITFEIAQIQLEEGPMATQFEYRPYGYELALCQRYYEANSFRWFIGGMSSDRLIGQPHFVVEKRVVPTIAFTTKNYFNGTDTAVSIASSVVTAYTKYFEIDASSLSSGRGFQLTFTADAEI